MAFFADNTELKQYITGIQKNLKIETILENCITAERQDLKVFIGNQLLNRLNNNQSQTEIVDLLPYFKRALAHFAILRSIPSLSLSISDTGFQEVNTEKTTPAPKWKVEAFREEYLLLADGYLDDMIEFIMDNIDDYPEWEFSEIRERSIPLLIKSGKDLNKNFQIKNSSLAYFYLLSIIELAQIKYIDNHFSLEFVQHLNTTTNPTTKETEILKQLKRVLAYYTIIEAIPSFSFISNGSGLMISSQENSTENIKKMNALKESLVINADALLTTAKKYADENYLDFPQYADSDKYTATGKRMYQDFDNTEIKGFYVQ